MIPLSSPVYESDIIRDVTGPALRPGGLELTRRALSLFPLSKEAKVLDAGCGLGATVDYLQNNHGLLAMGLDASGLLVKKGGKQHPQALLVQGRAESLPLPDQSLDGVFCECMLSLAPDQPAVLQEFNRALRRGGLLFLSDLYIRASDAGAPELGLSSPCCLTGALPKELIENNVRDAGFDILRFEDHTKLLKQLAGRLVFAYGSLKNFWSFFTPTSCGADVAGKAASARPGYFLLIAEKRGHHE